MPDGRLPRPPQGRRLYAIGDSHGCLAQLKRLEEKILEDAAAAPEKSKTVVYLGDFVDRGPESSALVSHLIASPLPGFARHYIRGNHEEIMLRYLERREDPWPWLQNGAETTMRSYGVDVAAILARVQAGQGDLAALHRAFSKRMPRAHLDFYNRLSLSHCEGDYFFCHAGVHPARSLAAQRRQDLLWIREPFLDYAEPLEKVIVHGHTPTRAPEQRIPRIGIDTGAVYGGLLTALVITGARRYFLQA